MAQLARPARPATARDYTVVDIHNVSQSLVRQIEWLEQEIQASANRVVQLEADEEPAEGAAPQVQQQQQVNNDDLRADVQKKLTPLWQGSLKLTLSDDSNNKQLVYAIERVRVSQLHCRNIIGAKVSHWIYHLVFFFFHFLYTCVSSLTQITLNEPEKVLDMIMITPECAEVSTLGTNMDLEAKLAQLKVQLIS